MLEFSGGILLMSHPFAQPLGLGEVSFPEISVIPNQSPNVTTFFAKIPSIRRILFNDCSEKIFDHLATTLGAPASHPLTPHLLYP
jgi:hypothetical protein